MVQLLQYCLEYVLCFILLQTRLLYAHFCRRKMISTFVTAQNLRNITHRISTIICRNKSTENCVSHEQTSNVPNADIDLPTVSDNPYKKERRLCILCKLNIEPDYKNVRLLSQFQSRHTGRIYGKHITGLCTHKQQRVEQEIEKAQNAGLMGYMTKDPKYVKDPELFNPNNPFKPHPY
ncbi:mitochondrial ribosomal protein S18C [Calliopsis andreniformis]|uniref:mitochondrial ribosomal protein S18C n=1 Tax=Calliopsis andreniformis TaxID=337506 RepID=UPI003FCD27B7